MLVSTEQDVLRRMPALVRKHYHGVWMPQLETDYVEAFQEHLPQNWLEIIDRAPNISVEKIFDDKYMIRFCNPSEVNII